MKHPSSYLDWYVNVPTVKYDFRSSGLTNFKYSLDLGKTDLSANYRHGNPKTTDLLAKMYSVESENVFISSEGASGQNARVIRYLAERNKKKNEAIVEYPTYEPLLRDVQEYFPHLKRLERKENEGYRLDADALRKVISKRTGLIVLTNPHAPSGAISSRNELAEIMNVASDYGSYVVCDEIYAEFDRETIPTLFSVNPEYGIVTTSFTKAYGLGGLKLGVALAKKELVDELYVDVLNTVGNSPNVIQMIAATLLEMGMEELEAHRKRWMNVKSETEKWLKQHDLEHFPNNISVTYWVKMPMKDTYKWINRHAIPHYSVAPVPGAFFLFKNGYRLEKTNMIRLGLGAINPDKPNPSEALEALQKAMNTWGMK